MPKYDARCKDCGKDYEWEGPSQKAPGSCPHCGSDDTKIVWLTMPNTGKDQDPYKMLDGKIPSPKKIVSGPKYSSKTTT